MAFANFPAAVGADQIAGVLGQFWSTIGGLKHTFINRWDHTDETILEAAVTYTRQDGQTLTLPSVAILKPDGDKVGELRVFMDVAPIDEGGPSHKRSSNIVYLSITSASFVPNKSSAKNLELQVP